MFGRKREQGFGQGRGRKNHICRQGFVSRRRGGKPRHTRGLGGRRMEYMDYSMDPMDPVDFIKPAEVAAPADMAVGALTCPLCKNHCPIDDPGCKKGEAYFKAMNPEERMQ